MTHLQELVSSSGLSAEQTSRVLRVLEGYLAELEDGKAMLFAPAVLKVHRGEQVRFEIFNEGSWDHEFVLGTEEANRKHAELMKKFPDMEHADPNALRLSP